MMHRSRLLARTASRVYAASSRHGAPIPPPRFDSLAQRSAASYRAVSVLRPRFFADRRPQALRQLSSQPVLSPLNALVSSGDIDESKDTAPISHVLPNSPKRITLTAHARGGIVKQRTMRSFSTNSKPRKPAAMKASTSSPALSSESKTKSAAKANARIAWRDALKSPMKAIQYANQLRRDFFDWLKHIWAGVKLLAADVRVSSGILRRIVNGKQISRRERNFIVQTGVDLARLVPFSLFLIIPLAEFALPFALRLFPHMLPSQFQDDMKKTEDMKKQLKGRLEIAKYLRDVVEEKAKVIKSSSEDSELQQEAESLENFIDAIRSGAPVDSAEVSKFARLFNDEITIDGAARPQLVAMCKYMGLSQYGNDQFLRFKLRSRLNTIKNDDMQIMWEGGVNSLTDDEVIKACQDRGIRSDRVPKKELRKQLNDWLDLSQKKEIPSSLMIMSRAFFYTEADGLKETIGSLSEDVIMDAKQAVIDNEDRLAEARRQAKLIAMESEEEKRKEREDEERRKKKEEELAASEEVATDGMESMSDKQVLAEVEKREAKIIEQVFDTPSDIAEKQPPTEEPVETTTTAADEEELRKEQDDIRRLLVSLGELASESAVEKEREELENLKSELAEAEALQETGKSGGLDLRRFKSLVKKLEREVEKVDAVVGLRMKLLDKDNDGLMSFEELKSIMGVIAGDRDDEQVAETLRRLDADADGNVSKADLARLLKELQGETSALEKPNVTPPSKH